MSRLDPWRNGLEFPKGEAADRILQANFDEQAKFNDKIGLYLVGEASVSTQQAFTSTSFADWKGLKLSANFSGGLVMVMLNVQGTPTVGNVLRARLMVDDQEKRRWSLVSSSVKHACGWTWVGSVAGGQHTINVQAQSSGGGAVYLQDDSGSTDPTTSYLQVLEFTKG